MFIINRIVFFFNSIAIFALLISYLAPYISPEFLWYPAFLGLAYPALLILNILFIVYWLIFFNMKFLFSLAAIVIGFNYIPKYVQFNDKKASDNKPGTELQVVTFNARYFGQLDEFSSQETELFLDKLSRLNPDILCAQEYHVPSLDASQKLLAEVMNYFKKYEAANGMKRNEVLKTENVIIYSKHPIIQSGLVERENGSGNFTVYADIVKTGDTVRVINTHLQSIGFASREYKAIRAIMGDEDSLSFSELRNVGSKMKYAYMLRAKQVDAITDFISKSPYPVILCGDFNDSPVSYAYRTLKGELNDAFMEAASGLGRTYIGKAPSLRIDYILYDKKLQAYDYYAKGFDFSDHKMVSCKLKIIH
jgi:endonuclease/exonuclease/phosphatase family metal-dependent hydrolase